MSLPSIKPIVYSRTVTICIQDVVDLVLELLVEGWYLFCILMLLLKPQVSLSFKKLVHVTLGCPLVFSEVWRIGLFVLHSLDPNKGVVFRGRTRGWTVRGLEGDFCSVLVAVSGRAEEHPWCSTITASIQLDRYVHRA